VDSVTSQCVLPALSRRRLSTNADAAELVRHTATSRCPVVAVRACSHVPALCSGVIVTTGAFFTFLPVTDTQRLCHHVVTIIDVGPSYSHHVTGVTSIASDPRGLI